MRSDMVKELNENTHNFNKIALTNSVTLDWQYRPRLGVLEQSLTKMVIQKIKNSDKGQFEFKDMNDNDILNRIWPQKIQGKNPIKYIIDHSFGRPRDFVMFLNVVKAMYPEKETITPHMMKAALKEYSTLFYAELMNEINRNENKALIMSSLTLLKDTGKNTFCLKELETTFNISPGRYQSIENVDDIKQGVKELYSYSIIGSSKKVGQGPNGYRQVEYQYRNNAIDNPNLSGHFSIHFALRAVLNVGDNTKKENVI